MRNKRLIIIFSILVSITLVVLVTSMIFSVKKFNTRCLNYSYSDTSLDKEILKYAEEVKGKSIFTVNEQEIIDNIHKNIPDVSVINIERKFPDRLTVHYVKLFSYYEIRVQTESQTYYYSATFESRITEERTTPLPDEDKITIVSDSSDRLVEGDYFYTGSKKEIIKEIVKSFERIKLADERAAATFDFIDLEKETDCLYIGVTEMGITGPTLSPILIKIEGVSDLPTLFDKIRLGYSAFISPNFPSQNGDEMVYVINDKDFRAIKNDYY